MVKCGHFRLQLSQDARAQLPAPFKDCELHQIWCTICQWVGLEFLTFIFSAGICGATYPFTSWLCNSPPPLLLPPAAVISLRKKRVLHDNWWPFTHMQSSICLSWTLNITHQFPVVGCVAAWCHHVNEMMCSGNPWRVRYYYYCVSHFLY